MKIAKTFSIDCAHVLDLPYESKCRNLHGHTYEVTIVLEGDPNKDGMVFDYTKFPKEQVMELDHKTLVASRSEVSGLDYERRKDFNYVRIGDVQISLPSSSIYIMDDITNTTAEEIARHLFCKLYPLLAAAGATLESVSVSETEATIASYP